ncbi:Retrotransposon gag protein [Ceratocystis platani]|uniref:Retrotransposon gag protein n=1 Tax=Ceratocystis fimbriata f. sp. platani TaxID=88771 RepID=A0A0F8BIR3_CERFI|nr:Retrotransposon gag protein [Ceratocystis platani]
MDIDQSQESPNALRPRSLQFPSFDGNKGKYRIWKRRMVAALNLQRCTKLEDMIPALQIALVEEANEGVGRDLEKLEKKPEATTKDVWEILDKRFEDPFHRARASEKLENVRQRGRPLDDYIAEYSDLLQQAGGEDYHEDVKIRGLMRGLDDDLYDRMITTPTCQRLVDQIESLRRVSQRLEEAQRRKKPRSHTTIFNKPAEIQRGDPMDIDINTSQAGNRPTQGPGPGLPTDDAYRGKVSKWVSKEELQARKDAARNPNRPATKINNLEAWVDPPLEDVCEKEGKA